jgi:hypothetical protein
LPVIGTADAYEPMQFILDIAVLFFVYLIIFRRIIEPFMEGYRGEKKVYNQVKGSRVIKKSSTKLHPTEIEETTKPTIIDAEFTELNG